MKQYVYYSPLFNDFVVVLTEPPPEIAEYDECEMVWSMQKDVFLSIDVIYFGEL